MLSNTPSQSQKVQPEKSIKLKKVQYGGFEVSLLGYCKDIARKRPVWIDILGPRGAVRSLISRAMDKTNQGADSGETVAFFIEEAPGETNAFRCPDNNYKSFIQSIDNPKEIAWLPRNRKPAIHQGRVLSHMATSLAGDDEFYVPVYREIDIPTVDIHNRSADEIWQLYLRYTTMPHSTEFKQYQPPIWCLDLYNVYMFLSARVRVPVHEYWMPFIFKEASDRWKGAIPGGGRLIEFVKAYVDPLVLEEEDRTGQPILEHGAYHITGNTVKDNWQKLMYRNPDRFKGIEFKKIEHEIREVKPVTKNADDVELEAGEGEIFA